MERVYRILENLWDGVVGADKVVGPVGPFDIGEVTKALAPMKNDKAGGPA